MREGDNCRTPCIKSDNDGIRGVANEGIRGVANEGIRGVVIVHTLDFIIRNSSC